MDDFLNLDVIKAACQKRFDELLELNPEHALINYDDTGLGPADKKMQLDMLLVEFGPSNCDSDCPDDGDLYFTYHSLQNALDTAIVLERAKMGIPGPH